MSNYGNRADGTAKGRGYFGELRRPDGDISTELSVGVEIDGREVEIPALVPGLSASEVDHLLSGGEPTEPILDKAVGHARKRIAAGLSPFAGDDDGVSARPTQSDDDEYMDAWGKQ